MSAITHRIEKVFVEVNTGNLESANFIKNNLGRFLETDVLPKLEQALEQLNQTGKVARINSLNLNIATSRDDFFSDLEKKIVQRFTEKLESEIGPAQDAAFQESGFASIEIILEEKNNEEIFFFFLENGHLPWFGTESDVREFLHPSNWQEKLENHRFKNRITMLLRSDKLAAERFVIQFDIKTIIAFLLKDNSKLITDEANIVAIMHALPNFIKPWFFRFLLSASAASETQSLFHNARQFSKALYALVRQKNEKQIKTVYAEFQTFFRNTNIFNFPEKKGIAEIILNPLQNFKSGFSELEEKADEFLDEPQWDEEIEQEPFLKNVEGEIAVLNAGLVLLHPFLKPFFKTVQITDERGNIMEARRHLAVQLMYFLATGEEDFFESNLIFCKFLCGIPLEAPVPRESLLTQSEKKEANHLLKEVIKHWSALKNTSPDGLRQMFLQRDGKLFYKEKNYRLIVERKAQDVLLDKLSWNISLVKIPWLKDLLFVEW